MKLKFKNKIDFYNKYKLEIINYKNTKV